MSTPLADMFGAWSPYNYSFNSPVNLNDPTGTAPRSWSEWQEKYKEDALHDPLYFLNDCGRDCEVQQTDEEKNWNKVAAHYQIDEVVVTASASDASNISYVGWGGYGDFYISNEVDPYGITGEEDIDLDDSGKKLLNGGIKKVTTIIDLGEIITNSLKTSGKALSHLKVVNKSLPVVGKALSVVSIGVENQMVQNGTMSKGEFAYNTTGVVTSAVAGAFIGSAFGGVFGAGAGLLMGAGFDIGKEAGTVIYNGMSEGLGQFRSQIINNMMY